MQCFAKSDRGAVRKENQDRAAGARIRRKGCVVGVVCDGMGGAAGGRLASTLASETYAAEMEKALKPDMTPEQLREASAYAVAMANRAVAERAEAEAALANMGTTLVAAVAYENGVVITNVGDSRAYYITEAGITRITKDHSLVETMVDHGDITADEARRHPGRNLITRALGRDTNAACDGYIRPMEQGDFILLCTDGLTGKLSDSRLQAVLGADMPLPELGQALMAQALDAGPGDNITLVLIEVTALDPETAVPLPQPPVEELSQTRRFEVSAERIAEQETQRKKQARARRREWVLTVSVILAVLCAVVAALWIAVGSIPRKPPAPAPTPVQTAAPTPSPTPNAPPQVILPPMPTPEPEPEPTPEPSTEPTPTPSPETTSAPERFPG